MAIPAVSAFTVLALLHFVTAVDRNDLTVRSIPSTQGNQQFFSLSQSLIVNGERKISSCGPDLPEIERCIRVCNSPGLAERGGCCCIARPNDFTVGIRGGCRFSQRVQNFTSRFIYKSSPVDSNRPFFGATNCARNAFAGTGAPCTCNIQWEVDTEVLQLTSPLPTPSVSASPVLTATPSAVPSTSPIPTPEPSVPVDSSEPPSEETATPTPDSELIPIGPTVPASSPSPAPSQRPDEGLLPTDDEDPDPSPTAEAESTPDDAEQQASEDDGSVCVDERYLTQRGFDQHALVHKEGVMANVLCPFGRTLPCGTRDHKVRFAGRDMSYEYMCAHPDVRCRATRMKVNSVYSHLWTEVAHEDVMLTMFDVRYSETAQKALHTVMRAWRTASKSVFA